MYSHLLIGQLPVDNWSPSAHLCSASFIYPQSILNVYGLLSFLGCHCLEKGDFFCCSLLFPQQQVQCLIHRRDSKQCQRKEFIHLGALPKLGPPLISFCTSCASCTVRQRAGAQLSLFSESPSYGEVILGKHKLLPPALVTGCPFVPIIERAL